MNKNSRLWIIEYIIEPEPGFSVAKLLDLEVLIMSGGCERTIEEYTNEADIVKETLRKMADLCGDGSIIAQDFYSKAYISGEMSKIAKRSSRMMGRMGEPWVFGIDMANDPKAAVESFLKDCGLKMTEYIQFGEKLDVEPYNKERMLCTVTINAL